MGFSVSYNIIATDKFSAITRKVGEASEAMRNKILKANTALASGASKVGSYGDKFKTLGKSFEDIGQKMTLRLTAPIAGIGIASLKAYAGIETATVAFEALLGSADKAGSLVKELNMFASKTPYEFEGISKSAKMLLVAGVSADKLTEKMTFLGDIASQANMPLEDMTYIFTKIKNKGIAQAEELNMMSERSVPILQEIAKMYGINVRQVMEYASKGVITSAVVEKALTRMSSKGGIAFQAMEKQSHTLAGVWSTMKDSITMALAEVGKQLAPTVQILMQYVIKLADAVGKFAKEHPTLLKYIAIFAGILAIIPPVLMAFGVLAQIVGFVTTGFTVLSTILGVFGAVIGAILSPVGLIVIGIMALIAGITLLIVKWDKVKSALADGWDWVKNKTGFGDNNISADINKNVNGAVAVNNSTINKNQFQGNLAIDIRDKGGNVAGVKSSSKGSGLNMGYTGAGK